MPTPEENMQSVRAFAEEVFGNKNLDYAAEWLAATSSNIRCSRAPRQTRRAQSIRIVSSSRHRPT
jgi:hypothetical protein